MSGNDNNNFILIRSLSLQECPLSVWRSANLGMFLPLRGLPSKLCGAHRGLHWSLFRRLPLAGRCAGRKGACILPFQPGSQALLLQPMRNAHGIPGRTLSGRNSSLFRYPRKSSRFRAQLSCALPGKAIMASFGRFAPSLSWECSC